MPLIPQQFHFVWVGGPLRPQYYDRIKGICEHAARSGFTVNIWVDDSANITTTANVKREDKIKSVRHLVHKEQVHDVDIPNLNIRNISELSPRIRTDEVYQVAKRAQRLESAIAREMVGLKNLAAASDFLRLEILRQHGGYYFDTDIRFFLSEGSPPFHSDNAEHGILITGKANDIIAAVPNNDCLVKSIFIMLDIYDLLDTTSSISQIKEDIAGILRDSTNSLDQFIERLPVRKSYLFKDVTKPVTAADRIAELTKLLGEDNPALAEVIAKLQAANLLTTSAPNPNLATRPELSAMDMKRQHNPYDFKVFTHEKELENIPNRIYFKITPTHLEYVLFKSSGEKVTGSLEQEKYFKKDIKEQDDLYIRDNAWAILTTLAHRGQIPKVERWSVRRDLTIEASGPGILIDVVRNEAKKKNWDKKSVLFTTTDNPENREFIAAGIKVKSEYDNTWLERPTQIGPFTR